MISKISSELVGVKELRTEEEEGEDKEGWEREDCREGVEEKEEDGEKVEDEEDWEEQEGRKGVENWEESWENEADTEDGEEEEDWGKEGEEKEPGVGEEVVRAEVAPVSFSLISAGLETKNWLKELAKEKLSSWDGQLLALLW